jgi:hypothetical protein
LAAATIDNRPAAADEPASTISTISIVAASVMRKPAANSGWMPSRFSMVAIHGLPLYDDGIDHGLSGARCPGQTPLHFFGAHGMAAIFDDDGRHAHHVRQRLGWMRAW